MAKSKYTDLICVVIILLLLAVTVLFHFGSELGIEKVERDSSHGSVSYAAVIALSDGESQIHGSGVYQNGKAVVIAHGGEYTVTGRLTDGQLVVEAESGAEVRIILDGADIFCSDSAALWVKNAGDTVIELADGSENRLACGAVFSAEAVSLDVEGALHSEDDLILRGAGRLTVESAYKHAVVCKDALRVDSGSYNLSAAQHGLRGRDSVEIRGGSFVICTEKDGIQSNNDVDPLLGTVTIRGGSFDIEAGQDGIQAETALYISGGDFFIRSGRGSESVAYAPGLLPWEGADAALSDSAKGLKAGSDLTISSGVFELDCEDDALHCGGSLLVEGGEFSIRSGDDALHGDAALTVAGGSLCILDAQEGMEAPQLQMTGGKVYIICRNDGLNANGETGAALHIRGGRLNIVCQGDGIDSNGDILVSGGEVTVSAQPSDGNSALDYAAENGGRGLIHGGSVIACGFGGMAESFSADSDQYSILFHLEEVVAGGTELLLLDSEGTELMRYTPAQDYNAVLLSSPELREGGSYTLRAGSEKCSITLSERSSVYGNGGRGFGGMGGMPPSDGMMPPKGAGMPPAGEMPPNSGRMPSPPKA